MGHTLRRSRRLLLSALAIIALASVVSVALRANDSGSAASRRPLVHAERSGLRLGTVALTGRVNLVASRPGLRWRIAGVSDWRSAPGRVLVRGWDTTTVRDGRYRLELDTGHERSGQSLDVRNSTSLPLDSSPLANASLGLDTRSTDARAVVAAFDRRSYRPGDTALLEFPRRYPRLRLEVLHVGPEWQPTRGDRTMNGLRVGALREATNARRLRIRIGNWESGVYAARLSSGGRVGFAPFVLRPRELGENRVAVVQPTNTWQAYNYRCANGDGIPDTWYYTAARTTVDASRSYLDRGVPPHFRPYDLGFLHWLARAHKRVDMLAQEDLERLDGDRLAELYRLIVFPGHHEYVTESEYDAVQRFRDLGGNLAFLSANNFYYRVNRQGDHLTRIGRWRDLGRPEAALVGVQYFGWNQGKHASRQYTVVGTHHARWLFAGTGLRDGARLGWWGIEADERTSASPRATRVLASMTNAFDTGHTAELTYYETARGARVFAAGAFTLAGRQATRWTTRRLLGNLWERLAGQPPGWYASTLREGA